MGKTKKKTARQFEVLLEGEFCGMHDFWTEYLCLTRNPDGSITLTSCGRQILAEAARYKERGWLPATIGRKEVHGFDGVRRVGRYRINWFPYVPSGRSSAPKMVP